MTEISGFGICVPRLLDHHADRIQLQLSSANIRFHLHDFSQQNGSISHQSSLVRARELVPDQVFFIAAQLDTSGRKYGVINDTRKSCHRRGRAVLIVSFSINWLLCFVLKLA